MNKFSNSIPMSTQLLDEFSSEENDIRFTKVKIWLMHTGKNLNGSIFNKETVEKAIPTLANTPIMASISYNFLDEKDFAGHETDIEITEDGELKLVNATVPYGVIPETNNAKFETRLGDDMVEREYLTCEGILWNKWDDAIDILYNKRGVTSQSMELSSDYTGYFDGEFFNFDSFSFYGACLLGTDVTPAMNNSTVEIKYASNTQELINEKLNMFNAITFNNKGGNQEVPIKKEQTTESTEEVVEKEVTADPEVTVDVQAAPEAVETQTESVEGTQMKDQVTIQEQTIEDIAEVHKDVTESQDELPQAKDLITISGVEYSIEDIEKQFAELKSYKEKFEEAQSKFEALQKEVHEEKVEKLFSAHKENLSVEVIEDLKSKSDKLTIEDLETQIFAAIGRSKYSTNQVKDTEAESTIQFSHVSINNNKPSGNSLDEIVASWK